jgi:DNA-binding LytR/AlgR family response regulator
MILMRLADAIKEVGQTAGLQVHRSHWVAAAAVTSAKRTGDRAILTMSHGADIPVSRTYIPAIKEAGLLPA